MYLPSWDFTVIEQEIKEHNAYFLPYEDDYDYDGEPFGGDKDYGDTEIDNMFSTL